MQIDREGIFQARPTAWFVRKQDSGSVCASIDWVIATAWNGSDWDDWSNYQEVTAYGDCYIVKKDGTINQTGVDQLAKSLGWDGDLRTINGDAPSVLAQITVKAETHNGTTRHKVSWINPADYVPSGNGAAPEELDALQTRFGSLLRAAASGAAGAAPPAAPHTPPAADGDSTAHPDSTGDDGLPF